MLNENIFNWLPVLTLELLIVLRPISSRRLVEDGDGAGTHVPGWNK